MKNRVKLLVTLPVLVVLGLSSCGGNGSAVEDKPWVLESYGTPGNLEAVVEGTEITATFESAEHRVHGSAGCNSYFGDYEIGKEKLSVPIIGSTEMYCMDPQGVMDQEQRYLKLLQSAETYQIENSKLRITSGDEVLVFRGE